MSCRWFQKKKKDLLRIGQNFYRSTHNCIKKGVASQTWKGSTQEISIQNLKQKNLCSSFNVCDKSKK